MGRHPAVVWAGDDRSTQHLAEPPRVRPGPGGPEDARTGGVTACGLRAVLTPVPADAVDYDIVCDRCAVADAPRPRARPDGAIDWGDG